MNNTKLYLLFVTITVLLIIPGVALGGYYGAAIGLALAMMWIVYSYYRTDMRIIEKLGATKLTDKTSWIHELVARVAKKARLSVVPEVYLIATKAPNACVIGRNPERAKLCLTEGLLEALTKAELEGVIGHELSHLRTCDTKLGGVVSAIVGSLMKLTAGGRHLSFATNHRFKHTHERPPGAWNGLLTTLVTPLAGAFVQLVITRNREFLADKQGATFTNRFGELASALVKIQRSSERMDSDNFPHLAHLFIYSSFRRPFLSALFSSHPPIAERVAQLEKLATTGGGVDGVY